MLNSGQCRKHVTLLCTFWVHGCTWIACVSGHVLVREGAGIRILGLPAEGLAEDTCDFINCNMLELQAASMVCVLV